MTDFTGLRFMAFFPDIPLDGKFILRDLPGSGKRIDVLCRSLAACFDWASNSKLRDKLEFNAILSHSLLLRFKAPQDSTLKSETWWASVVKDAIKGEPPEFVTTKEVTLEDAMQNFVKECPNTYVLETDGEILEAIVDSTSAPQYSFMLGNHRGFDERTLQIIQDLKIQRVSLGKQNYLGSHCVAAVISHFERIGK